MCRLGYRVARHWSDLTVTPYERQIRLDQHLDQRNTYSFRTSESELPRPDLPPKTVVELPEDTEISLESSSLVVNEESSITTDGESEDTSETRSERQPVQPIVEVIDVLDSSDESASDKSSSDDSDVEIIHESAPNINKGRNIEVVDGDSESDVEVIEVLNPKKEIIVETIDSSSDSEEVEQSSDSGSDKSHDGNWKRNSNNKRNRCQRPSIMNHYMFLSAHEFCVEKSASERSQDFQSASVENNESVNVNNNIDYPEHGGLIVNRVARPKFTVEKSRNEILDLMPSMGGHKNKLLPMSAPDLRLIPENIIPKQQSYTFSMNTLKARVFKPGFRGRFRGFPGPRYGNFNSYSNNRVQSFYPNQINSMSSFTPNPALAQMFGSDIHSMARGMMQFASSLLLNLPQNNQTNSLSPFSQQPSPNFHGRNSNYSQPGFSSHMQHSVFEPRNSRFNNSSYNSFNSGMNRNPQQFCTNNFRPVLNQDNLQRSLTPYSRLSDADFPERNFTPPPRPNNNKNIQRKTSYMPNRVRSRNAFRRNRSRQRLPPISPRTDDPAYIKPDVPFCRNPNSPQERLDSSIPLKVNSDVDMETIQIIDDDNLTPGRRIGTYMAKQKRSKRQRRREMNKKMRFDTNIKPEIIFLDSPLSNDSSADLLEVKNQANNVPSENNTSESSSGQNFEVKQESRGDSLEIKKEQTTQTIVKNEPSVTETSVKSENCCDISVKSEQNEFSNSQTEIKTESSSNSSLSVSTVSIETLVKSESSISFKSEPDVKLEESNIKHENSCHCHDIIPVKPYEVNKVKLENLSNVVSDNNVDTTVNANVSQQDQEVAKETSTISTSSVIHSEVPLSDEIQNNENLQLISNEMEVEESDDVLRNTSEIAAGTSIKNMDSEEEEISLSNVSSWAEVKKHNIPISNLPESITDKESGSDDEDGDEIKPLIRPKHCRTIGNYDSICFYSVFTLFSCCAI